VDRSWECINRSQIHECGNWEGGRAVSFLGTHKSVISCRVFSIPVVTFAIEDNSLVFEDFHEKEGVGV
jgi:hypothetical protein